MLLISRRFDIINLICTIIRDIRRTVWDRRMFPGESGISYKGKGAGGGYR